jgi:hypothetical protein
MDKNVEKSLLACLKQFSKISRHDTTDFCGAVLVILKSDKTFLEKVSDLDACFDKEPKIEILRELFFDLLLINFFAEDVKKLEEDYLDSAEWETIEEDTLERGTEILNLLLYLKECDDEEIEPELSDYLNEFLLVDDDEFQDEHHIYEDIISNQILVESSFEEIAKAAKKLPESSEVKELFYPILSFFLDQNPSQEQLIEYAKHSMQPDFDSALYQLLITYNQNHN